MDRTEETEDEVDFRPRSPVAPDERRTVDRGVSGEGESDWRLYEVGRLVCMRGRL